MVKTKSKNKPKKKAEKKVTKNSKEVKKEEANSGMDLDDAFADDEDVEYGESKPRKQKKKKEEDLEEELDDAEEDLEELEKIENGGEELGDSEVTIKASKAVSAIKKGDKVRVDDKQLEVDAHYVMIDHGKTKEMAIELFDPNADKDYQLRYFSDQVETSLEFYELQEILYVKRKVSKVEW
ncbi:MAG: hypothetical protein Q8Q31_02580 [Nanoarchaeota archaeon]|nr:hypothetical protein [Nanoarchaeota archaeon]